MHTHYRSYSSSNQRGRLVSDEFLQISLVFIHLMFVVGLCYNVVYGCCLVNSRTLEKRLQRALADCENEAEHRRKKEAAVLDLEKQLAIVKLERKESSKLLEATEETKSEVSGVVCHIHTCTQMHTQNIYMAHIHIHIQCTRTHTHVACCQGS